MSSSTIEEESTKSKLSTINEESPSSLPPRKRFYCDAASNNTPSEPSPFSSSSSSSSSSSPTRRKNVRIRRLSLIVRNTSNNNSIINSNTIKPYTQPPIDDKFREQRTDEDTEVDETSVRFQWVSDPVLLHYIFSLDPNPSKRIITELSIGFGVRPRDIKQWFRERSASKTISREKKSRRTHKFIATSAELE
eukprot:TRINITY_DN1483_c0_g1_i1.p1 TRINITY_DN1483_c0_g1~~TRINITY_DN1483_c0_g1_i1.p1  ORF type:complete len:192 (+),score=41.88 TRINITY_DN1483_c0_g1_i1:271-846(+)